MAEMKQIFACSWFSSGRHSRLQLYAIFAAICFFFIVITLIINTIPYLVNSKEEITMPSANWLRMLANQNQAVPKVLPVSSNNTRDRQRLMAKPASFYETITSKPSPPHAVWDTSFRHTDRILEQLYYIPKRLDLSRTFKILVWEKSGGEEILPGKSRFIQDRCLVNNCELLVFPNSSQHIDAVITSRATNNLTSLIGPRRTDDIWIYYELESPKTLSFSGGWVIDAFNWTATYRHDSTIVAPYEKWFPFDSTDVAEFRRTSLSNETNVTRTNYARGKNKMAAAVISNCGSRERMMVIAALSEFIKVDVYGYCGVPCPYDCFQMIGKNYKFYLAFENAKCFDYITEKFFRNALSNDIVPVAFGAPPPDYFRAAPPFSYIHVENFPSVQHLAKYLLELHRNDYLYNFYFKWKDKGTFINTKFWCRLCALLNDLDKPRLTIPDLGAWLTYKTCES